MVISANVSSNAPRDLSLIVLIINACCFALKTFEVAVLSLIGY